MIRHQLDIQLEYSVDEYGADIILNIHAAQTPYQSIVFESFTTNPVVHSELFSSTETGNRYVRLRANPGRLLISYLATIEMHHVMVSPSTIKECRIADLPTSVINYIYPSRYCQSDRLTKFAIREFGKHAQGYSRVQAIQKWVQDHISFISNSSNSNTAAIDTIIEQAGVCRDFAHVMIALCRALSIPARFVTGTDYGADASLGPPDFHAYVEVFLDNRWFIFDPSGTAIPMGLPRIGTGRDAADVSFATIFGTVVATAPKVTTTAITSMGAQYIMPYRCDEALSSSDA